MAQIKRGPEPGTEKAKHGGQAVRAKYGEDFYRQIGQKSGQSVKAKRGSAFDAEIGRQGGEATKAHQGPDFYSRIGKVGSTKRGKPKTNARRGTAREESEQGKNVPGGSSFVTASNPTVLSDQEEIRLIAKYGRITSSS